MTEITELRVINLGKHGFAVAAVDFVDGQSRRYCEDNELWAPNFEALRAAVQHLAAALDKPILQDATDFPDQCRIDKFSTMFSEVLGTPTPRRASPKQE